MKNPIIGIDEVGRGPLAGPVTVGAFIGDKKIGIWILKNIFPRRQRVGAPTEPSGDNRIRDSKKLTEKQRYTIYRRFLNLKKEGKIDFKVSHIGNNTIDKIGISKAIKMGIQNLLSHKIQKCQIRLDGLLKAPEIFKNQKTIIKGDEKDVFIACASIVAKVSRDALMCRLAKKYPEYNFEIHKGYGTKLHISLIKKHGLSQIHRKSFCKKLILG